MFGRCLALAPTQVTPLIAACNLDNSDASSVDLLLARKPKVSGSTVHGEIIVRRGAKSLDAKVRIPVFECGLEASADVTSKESESNRRTAIYTDDGMQGLKILLDVGASFEYRAKAIGSRSGLHT